MVNPESFDPKKAAHTVFEAVNTRSPGKITQQEAITITKNLVDGARILDFITPLAINKAYKRVLKKEGS